MSASLDQPTAAEMSTASSRSPSVAQRRAHAETMQVIEDAQLAADESARRAATIEGKARLHDINTLAKVAARTKAQLAQATRSGKAVSQTVADGKLWTWPDGTTQLLRPDGTRRETHPKTGTVIEVSQDGKTRVNFFTDGTLIEQHTDGSSVQLNPDGTRVATHADGVVVSDFPTKTVTTRPDGRTVVRFHEYGYAHTTLVIEPDGTRISDWPEYTVTVTTDGERKVFWKADGETVSMPMEPTVPPPPGPPPPGAQAPSSSSSSGPQHHGALQSINLDADVEDEEAFADAAEVLANALLGRTSSIVSTDVGDGDDESDGEAGGARMTDAVGAAAGTALFRDALEDVVA